MPNWCANSLSISGSKTDIKKLLKIAIVKNNEGENELNCNGIIPVPPALMEQKSPSEFTDELEEANIKKYGFKDWYSFRLANWGTKWAPEVENMNVSPSGRLVGMFFSSAWTPPCGIIDQLAKMFPKCLFALSFFEGGAGFAGRASWEGGESNGEENYAQGDGSYEEIGRDEFGMGDMFDQEAEDKEKEAKEAKETKKKEKKAESGSGINE